MLFSRLAGAKSVKDCQSIVTPQKAPGTSGIKDMSKHISPKLYREMSTERRTGESDPGDQSPISDPFGVEIRINMNKNGESRSQGGDPD